jgi:hypothetical protein
MNNFAKSRDMAPLVATLDESRPRGLGESSWMWFAGFCGVLTIFAYREVLRLMMWARSWNW